jgi:hypothetical protein
MGPGVRKLALTAHVISSVGWLGAVAGFLALSIVGVTSHDRDLVRGAYLAMNVIGEFVIVPLCVASLLTGIVQALGTPWGLFRHYWVLTKFVLTLGATVLLLLHQFTAVVGAARLIAENAVGGVGRLGSQLVVDAGLALFVLFVTTTLSIYKPWGRTKYGQRRLNASPSVDAPGTSKTNMVLMLVAIVACFLLLHFTLGQSGHGMKH